MRTAIRWNSQKWSCVARKQTRSSLCDEIASSPSQCGARDTHLPPHIWFRSEEVALWQRQYHQEEESPSPWHTKLQHPHHSLEKILPGDIGQSDGVNLPRQEAKEIELAPCGELDRRLLTKYHENGAEQCAQVRPLCHHHRGNQRR